MVPGYSWELLTLSGCLFMCALEQSLSNPVPIFDLKSTETQMLTVRLLVSSLPLSLLRHDCNCSCDFLHIFLLFSFPFILNFSTKGKCFESGLTLTCPSHHIYDLCLSYSWMYQAVTVNIRKWVKGQRLSKPKKDSRVFQWIVIVDRLCFDGFI